MDYQFSKHASLWEMLEGEMQSGYLDQSVALIGLRGVALAELQRTRNYSDCSVLQDIHRFYEQTAFLSAETMKATEGEAFTRMLYEALPLIVRQVFQASPVFQQAYLTVILTNKPEALRGFTKGVVAQTVAPEARLSQLTDDELLRLEEMLRPDAQ